MFSWSKVNERAEIFFGDSRNNYYAQNIIACISSLGDFFFMLTKANSNKYVF